MEWQDAVMRYLLDSDTCIFGLRDNQAVMDKLLSLHLSDWAISSLTAFELHRGVVRGLQADVSRQTLEFLRTAQILTFGSSEAALAASIERQLGILGKSVGVVDVLIGAHALSQDLTLVTNNTKHFQGIPGLRLDNWL
jgi:tRNA(fMet)-specific endonuclease VapC